MLFVPALENLFEVRASFSSFLQNFHCILIKIKLDCKGRDHKIEYNTFIVEIVDGVVDNVLNVLGIVENSFVPNIPSGFSDQVGQEYHFYFI